MAILIQTDRFGTSMGESLRTHSDFMRLRRKQEAEERAAKVGVKLVFPIFLFILPSMMVVAAGPALLKVFQRSVPDDAEFREVSGEKFSEVNEGPKKKGVQERYESDNCAGDYVDPHLGGAGALHAAAPQTQDRLLS